MITIILPISRTDYLRPVFECLDKLQRPADTELLIITDGDDSLARAVDRRLDSISYKRIQVINFGDKPGEDIDSRRYRISAIHNKAKHFVGDNCDYVFLTEDDTTYPPDTLTKMLKTFEDYGDNCAFVEGVELGRRKTPYIGAWKTDNCYDPNLIESLLPIGDLRRNDLITGIIKGRGGTESIEEIDAGGFYCALVDSNLYESHHFEPLDKLGTNGLSCDVNFGMYLRQQGYSCHLDWSIQCDHIGEKGSVDMGNTKPVQVVFEKVNNKWFGRTL